MNKLSVEGGNNLIFNSKSNRSFPPSSVGPQWVLTAAVIRVWWSCCYLVDKCSMIVLDRKRLKTLFDRRSLSCWQHTTPEIATVQSLQSCMFCKQNMLQVLIIKTKICSLIWHTERISLTLSLSLKTARNPLWNTSYSACATVTVDVKNKIFISVFDIVFWLKIHIGPTLHCDVYVNRS